MDGKDAWLEQNTIECYAASGTAIRLEGRRRLWYKAVGQFDSFDLLSRTRFHTFTA